MLFLTVVSSTTRCPAITVLDRPWVSSRSTSSSPVEFLWRGGRGLDSTGELGDETRGDRCVDEGVPGGGCPHAGHGRPGGASFSRSDSRCGWQCAIDVLVEVERGHDDDPGCAGGDDPSGRLQPVHGGHADVHHHHVGAKHAELP